MTILQCAFCREGPFQESDIVRIKTTKQEFTICGQGKCVKRMFTEHDPATFPPQAAICLSCKNYPAVATVTDRGIRPLSVCERCLLALFFDSSSVS